ncbi:MAG: hypothetical protein A2Y62_14030 [Candidatus Fischerbacteria bacterium RBG_13_37_8]|uniref:endopeptidase La n=1 Tax=Candidatus Fischerbacteria bacterium RBG_13_37_8 TaxID=1817863 RepID=A0A1F5VFN3_9BACT|nr:MAG: hypothetical protein A2Y62_14030 [Candidatus Fischerbacteria bacterium RBG_13_37_8]
MAWVKLGPKDVYRKVDIATLTFETTEELKPLSEYIGQDRAINAITFGLGMDCPGYNIYVAGPIGTGKTTLIKNILSEYAKKLPKPPDWCFVNNFKNEFEPKALSFPAGEGKVFEREMKDLLKTVKDSLLKVFESKQYQEEQQSIIEDLDRKSQELFQIAQQKALMDNFQLKATTSGIQSVYMYRGKPITQEDYEKLEDEKKKEILDKKDKIDQSIREIAHQIALLEREAKSRAEQLKKDTASFALEPLFAELIKKYAAAKNVIEYLNDAMQFALQHLEEIVGVKKESHQLMAKGYSSALSAFDVNVIVDNSEGQGAPVVFEHNPTFVNLFGSIERRMQMGILVTDFSMIRAGSLLKANGGFLVVEALDALRYPFVWDTLKRTMETGQARIEDIGQLYGLAGATAIRAEPIPIHLKLVVLGNPYIYHLLLSYDEDFVKLFRVKADFNIEMNRDMENVYKYAFFITTMCQEKKLKPFTKEAVAKIVEHSSRLAGDQNKLSIRLGQISNVAKESSYWASVAGQEKVTEEFVEKAIEEKIMRSNRIETKMREMIVDGTFIIEIEGKQIGQINGLAVYDLGDYMFGKPSRITCATFVGQEGVINIERKARLSGSTYDKGVLILTGYLGKQYAHDKPLTLSASMAFEQSYEMIDGDSASGAELITLLSSLAEVPIRQDLAITGSLSQKGEIQPIGGVNEKIEGFYFVCKEKGLTGSQGVVIPSKNVRNLMLRKEVIQSIAEEKFHIYSVENIDDVIEIFADMTPGKKEADGTYQVDSFHWRVDSKLKEYSKVLKPSKGPKTDEHDKE